LLNFKIFENKTIKPIIFNMGWLSFDKFFRLLVGLIVTVWVIRYLGPESFGVWSYALAIVNIFSIFSTLGLSGIVLRELVKPNIKDSLILGTSFYLKLLGSIFGIIFVLLFTFLFLDWSLLGIYVFIISFGFIFQSFDVVEWFFHSRVEAKYVVIARNFSFFLVAVIKLLFVFFGLPLIYFVLTGLIEIILGAISLILIFKFRNFSFNWKFDFSVAKNLLSDSWPLIFSTLALIIYARIDQIMIGLLLNNYELGLYSAAVKISEIWQFIPGVLLFSVFPSLTRSKLGEKYYSRLQKVYDSLNLVAMLISIFVLFFGYYIMLFLFGVEYIDATFVLVISTFAGIFVFLSSANGKFLLIENLTKISLYITILGAITNVIINFYLIPLYGINGAAIATFISYGVATFSVLLFSKSRKAFVMSIKSFNYFRIINEYFKYLR
jgi:PST family polysaccharide transporter